LSTFFSSKILVLKTTGSPATTDSPAIHLALSRNSGAETDSISSMLQRKHTIMYMIKKFHVLFD